MPEPAPHINPLDLLPDVVDFKQLSPHSQAGCCHFHEFLIRTQATQSTQESFNVALNCIALSLLFISQLVTDDEDTPPTQ